MHVSHSEHRAVSVSRPYCENIERGARTLKPMTDER